MEKKKLEVKLQKTPNVEVSAHAPKAEVKRVKNAPPASDMQAICNVLKQRLEAEGISVNKVNAQTPYLQIEKDFVSTDYPAMIPPTTGPRYSPHNFLAKVTCVVPKGQNTNLRLAILKDVVRAALMEPFEIRKYQISAFVVNEQDSRAVGVRTSELTISMSASKRR